MKRTILALALLIATSGITYAQETAEVKPKQSFKEWALGMWKKTFDEDPGLDSDYIFQPYTGIGVAAGYQLNYNSVKINSLINVTNSAVKSMDLNMNMSPRPSHNVSINGGYGPIWFGYSYEIGQSSSKDKSFDFSFTGKSIILDFVYKDIYVVPSASMAIDSEYARNRTVMASAIYAFNSKKFSYKAAYDGRQTIQRKSAGSFVVAAKYMYGNTVLDPSEFLLMSISYGIGRYQSHQASIGAGYSFNWVLFHRDAVNRKDFHNFRNLTFNVTAIPLLTLYNQTITDQYNNPEPYRYSDEIKESVSIFGHVQPNFTARAGLGFSIYRFYMSLWGTMNTMVFKTSEKYLFTSEGDKVFTMSQNGTYSSYNVRLELKYRF